MNFIKLLSYTKPILFWMVALALLCEVLIHSFLNELPLKFLAHSTGPIHRLGQYSKKDVVPKEEVQRWFARLNKGEQRQKYWYFDEIYFEPNTWPNYFSSSAGEQVSLGFGPAETYYYFQESNQ